MQCHKLNISLPPHVVERIILERAATKECKL